MRYDSSVPEQYRPISAWGYVGYTILFAIPIVGLVLLIVFSLDSSHINRRSFARSYWAWLLLGVIVIAALIVVISVTGGAAYLKELMSLAKESGSVANMF